MWNVRWFGKVLLQTVGLVAAGRVTRGKHAVAPRLTRRAAWLLTHPGFVKQAFRPSLVVYGGCMHIHGSFINVSLSDNSWPYVVGAHTPLYFVMGVSVCSQNARRRLYDDFLVYSPGLVITYRNPFLITPGGDSVKID